MWYFVYTREAHPGDRLPAHPSFEDKLACARRLRDEVGIRREILVDDLDGTVHTAYGLMPNMTWVLGRRGVIMYKAMWTSAERVAEFCAGLALAEPPNTARFYTEQLELRAHDMPGFMKLLERNGPGAAKEFERAIAIWTARARQARRSQA